MGERVAHSDVAKASSEFIGTMILTLVIALTGLTHTAGGAMAAGFTLLYLVYSLGPVSGGHFNPAVTLAAALTLRSRYENARVEGDDEGVNTETFVPQRHALLYVAAQLAGGFVATALAWGLSNEVLVLAPRGYYSTTQAFVIELLFTGLLCYVVLSVGVRPESAGNQYFGTAIGFTLLGSALCAGSVSGCVLNPAVAFGALVSSGVAHGSNIALKHSAMYLFTPILGCVLGAVMFRCVRGRQLKTSLL